MSTTDESELRELQVRAYGRNADLHLDPVALERLRELEALGRLRSAKQSPEAPASEAPASETPPPGTAAPGTPASEAPAPETPAAADLDAHAHDDETALESGDPSEPVAAVGAAAPGRRWVRPGILIAVAAVIAAAAFGGGLLLGRSTLFDSSAPGTVQIARLPIDAGYTLPEVLGGGDLSPDARGFQDFHGLRVVVGDGLTFAGGTPGHPCMLVYRAQDISGADTHEFSGNVWTGCEADRFPATAQLNLKDDVPTSVTAALPGTKALQFVYDRKHRQVVVRASR